MRNLAGRKPHIVDSVIRCELKNAGVPRATTARSGGEVKWSIAGRLGAFTFERAWCYWVVTGPMPLPFATWMNRETIVPLLRYRTRYGARMAGAQVVRRQGYPAEGVVRVAGFAGGADPYDWHTMGYVDTYHVDTVEGLALLARYIRDLEAPLRPEQVRAQRQIMVAAEAWRRLGRKNREIVGGLQEVAHYVLPLVGSESPPELPAAPPAVFQHLALVKMVVADMFGDETGIG